MADNVLIDEGTGRTIAADDIGSGALAQRVKPVIGADGTGVDVLPVVNGMDTTGTGSPSAGILAQYDDVATGTVTENQFAPPRLSSRRALLIEGVASGTAVADNLTQIGGATASTVATGVLKVGTADSAGAAFLSAAHALNSTGAGVQASQMVAEYDDTSPTTITENQFGNVRMSSNRNVYATLRDAAGNERGANINASGQLSVSVDNSNASTNVAQINGATPLMGSGNTGTGSLRVTLATDQPQLTNKLLVTPDANSAVNLAQVAGGTASTVATGVLKVATADSAGTAFLSAAHALNSTGGGVQAVQISAEYDDTSPTAITENQFGNLRMSSNRNLYGTIRDAAGSERGVNVNSSNQMSVSIDNTPTVNATLGTETTKVIGTVRNLGNVGAIFDGVNTAATAPANGLLTLGIYNSTEPSPTTGQSVGIQLDSKGRQRQVIMDAAGNTRGANVNASNQLSVTVDNSNVSTNVAQIAGGTAATVATGVLKVGTADSTGAAFLSAANALNSTGSGIQAAQLVAQFDDVSPTSITENQFGNIRMSANRNVYNTIRDAAGNERGANVTAGNALAGDLTSVAGTAVVNGGVAGSQSIGGTVATNVAITANPLNLGAQAVSSENAAVTTARQVQLVADLVGKLIVLPYANPENFVSGAITTAMTGTTTTSLIAAPAAGLRNYITQITVSNAHATVGTDVIIQDGSGGTTLYTIPAAAVYGGATVTFPTPLRQPTTATAIFCANVTTGASTKVSASGYKGA